MKKVKNIGSNKTFDVLIYSYKNSGSYNIIFIYKNKLNINP